MNLGLAGSFLSITFPDQEKIVNSEAKGDPFIRYTQICHRNEARHSPRPCAGPGAGRGG